MAHCTWQDAVDPAGHPTREFLLRPKNSRLVTGAVWTPDDIASDVLICFGHGASGDRYQAPISYLANRLSKQGYVCLAMDGPVHGLRKSVADSGVAVRAELDRQAVVDDMVRDWNLSVSCIESELRITADRLAYFGLSMGTIFGIPFLASRELNGKSPSAAVLGIAGTEGAANQFSGRLLADSRSIRCPLLFLMQLEDELFSREGCLALFDAFGSSDKRLHANPGRHPEIPGEEVEFGADFVLKYLNDESSSLDRSAS